MFYDGLHMYNNFNTEMWIFLAFSVDNPSSAYVFDKS